MVIPIRRWSGFWEKQIKSGNKYFISNKNHISTLEIDELTSEDGGYYSVVVSNEAGEDEVTFHLTVSKYGVLRKSLKSKIFWNVLAWKYCKKQLLEVFLKNSYFKISRKCSKDSSFSTVTVSRLFWSNFFRIPSSEYSRMAASFSLKKCFRYFQIVGSSDWLQRHIWNSVKYLQWSFLVKKPTG